MWTVKNDKTGRTMKSFNTKSEAERFRKSLNKPKIHSVARKPRKKRYNFQNDFVAVVPPQFSGDSSTTFIIPGQGGIGDPPASNPSPPTSPEIDPTPTPNPPSNPSDPGGIIPPSSIPPTSPESGPIGTQPGGTTYPSNPLPTNPNLPVSPGNGLDLEIRDRGTQTNSEIAATMQAADMGESAMDDFWDEYGAAVGIGTALAAAGGAAAFDLNRDEDKSILRRLFSASRSQADSVFGEYSPSIRANKERMAELLRRDFARNGPLYQAWQSGNLSLSLDRSEWVAFGDRYSRANFPVKDWPGFASIKEKTSVFLVNEENGRVFSETDVRQKIKAGEWVGDKSKKSTASILHIIDEEGNRFTVNRYKRGQVIKKLGNTPENILAGVEYVAPTLEVAKDDERDTAKELRQAQSERKRLEAQLRDLEAKANRTIDPLKAIELQMQRMERQAETDRLQKEKEQKREEERLIKEQEREREREKTLIEAQQRLGTALRDNDVDDNRYDLDKAWVQRFVASGLGGAVASSDIDSYEYERDPSGEVLIVNYKDGSLPERWPRSLLIEMNGLPISYGPRFSPLWDSKRGVTTSPPEWASSIRNNPTTSLVGKASPMAKVSTSDLRKLFARPRSQAIQAKMNRIKRPYQRKIGDKVFHGQKWTYNNQRYAKAMARNLRTISNGKIGVRTVPTANGYRNYIWLGKRR